MGIVTGTGSIFTGWLRGFFNTWFLSSPTFNPNIWFSADLKSWVINTSPDGLVMGILAERITVGQTYYVKPIEGDLIPRIWDESDRDAYDNYFGKSGDEEKESWFGLIKTMFVWLPLLLVIILLILVMKYSLKVVDLFE